MEPLKGKSNYLNQLLDPGYIIFENSFPNACWFDEVYKLFDKVAENLGTEDSNELRLAALDWLKEEDNSSYFCGTPPAFRDRTRTNEKRNKIYLQYCSEFSNSERFAKTHIAQTSEMKELFEKLKQIEGICSGLFDPVLKSIFDYYPSLSRYYDFKRPLPIVLKLVRYNLDEAKFATDPHYDKSALSIIIHADDEKVSWRVGKGEKCPLSKMIAPFEYPKNNTSLNNSILFSGICLNEAGIGIPPAPHFVMPVTKQAYRHSLIAFLLVPNLPDTDKLNTQALFEHDILKEIN